MCGKSSDYRSRAQGHKKWLRFIVPGNPYPGHSGHNKSTARRVVCLCPCPGRAPVFGGDEEKETPLTDTTDRAVRIVERALRQLERLGLDRQHAGRFLMGGGIDAMLDGCPS